MMWNKIGVSHIGVMFIVFSEDVQASNLLKMAKMFNDVTDAEDV